MFPTELFVLGKGGNGTASKEGIKNLVMSFFYKKAYLAAAVNYERKMFMTLRPGRFRSFSNVV